MSGQRDGLALAQEIWRKWPSLPVILTSGDAVVDASQLPAHHTFVPKPWGISDLATMTYKVVTLPRQGGWSPFFSHEPTGLNFSHDSDVVVISHVTMPLGRIKDGWLFRRALECEHPDDRTKTP